jgi:predicted anti-sigma-YlaC factor YlaD
MTRSTDPCAAMREEIHLLFDEDGPIALPGPLREHLDACSGCREFAGELGALRSAFRELPSYPFPSEALDEVRLKTVHAPTRSVVRAAPAWTRAAAAAVVATALIATTWLVTRSVPIGEGPTDAELRRAEAQAELVFGYAARALDAARSAAAERVVASKISPAVRGTVATAPSGRRDRP